MRFIRRTTWRLSAILILVANVCGAAEAETGPFAKWSKVELAFEGPTSQGRGKANPFAVRLDVTFTSPSGEEYQVPGFYDGDGQRSLDGNVWKVRFSADEEGTWSYRTQSSNGRLDGRAGRFTVTAVPDDAKGYWQWGRLESIGTPDNGIRYLKFRDGPYWLKAGCDDPENFLGSYENYNTLADRKAAIDFLAERGINSLYIMTHNIDGDDNDVWPWLGATPGQAKANGGDDARFDIAKLEAWRELFEYMQARKVVPYLVLEDDSAWDAYDHQRYWREMIARFGYLPAILFNLGEEHNENYSFTEGLQFARQLDQIDPFDHPRGIHNISRARDEYVDAAALDFTSIQTGQPGTRRGVKHAVEHNEIAIEWIERCRSRGRRVLMVNFDEGRPELDRRAWWSAYLGGGVWEAHVVEPYDRPMTAWEPVWTELGGTRAFLETLPFWEMEPRNDLVKDGLAFCLAKPGAAYALYLPEGGEVMLELPEGGSYEAAWWNPDNGVNGGLTHESLVGGGERRFTSPGSGDWALRIQRPSLSSQETWERIAPFFTPPPRFADDPGEYRSPLLFDDGTRATTSAAWQRRREELLADWHGMMGPWPPVIEHPHVESLDEQQRDGLVQRRIHFDLAPDHPTEGYLLVPPGDGARPAVLVVYYEPETAIGEGRQHRDFALQLARRGFVTLSIGQQPSLFYPSRDNAQLQPLSALAYGAANAYHVLATQPEVDPERIGIVGHSYGGKWAMFAACLYDKFACGVWSDPGIVFDETRPNVNYWEPWYLGYEPALPSSAVGRDESNDDSEWYHRWEGGRRRMAAGVPTSQNTAFGLYPKLIENGRNLHELHALMAPRPFLVSGGSEDPPSRWRALHHAIEVNNLLGYENRVAMTHRAEHAPTAESNEQIALFFEYFLKDPRDDRPDAAVDRQAR